MSYASVTAVKEEKPIQMKNSVPAGWVRLFKHPVNGRACAHYGAEIKMESPKQPNALLTRFLNEEKYREDMNEKFGEGVSPYWNTPSYLDSEPESDSESESEEEEIIELCDDEDYDLY